MTDWSLANCQGLDPDLWFPPAGREGAPLTAQSRHAHAVESEGPGQLTLRPAHSPNLSERSEPMAESNPLPVALPPGVEHGTRKAYRTHDCRCDVCRAGAAAAHRDYIARRDGRPVEPRPRAPHVSEWRTLVAEDERGCLVWQSTIDKNGYARLGGQWAHRAVYEHEVGPIPPRHELDHVCENPPCVNPDHLDPVTNAEHAARTFRRLGKDDKHLSAAYLRTMGLTYKEIAEALAYQGSQGAHGAVSAAIRKGLVEPDSVPRFEPLSEQDCRDIVDLRRVGVPVSDIAAWYGIDSGTASRISRGARSGRDVA